LFVTLLCHDQQVKAQIKGLVLVLELPLVV